MSPTFRLSPAVTSRCGDAQSQAHKGFDSICHLVTYLSYRNKEKKIEIYKAERISKTEVTGDIPPLKGLAMRVCASPRSQVTLGDKSPCEGRLMDSRDYLDQDGWPVISDRDRLPLRWLLEGAALSAEFVKNSQMRTDAPHRLLRLSEIASQRDAVAHELLLPKAWHFAPIRSHRLDSRRIKLVWQYPGDGVLSN